MSEFNTETITDRAGTGKPDLTFGFKINGSDSGINPFLHTESANEPSNPNNGDAWFDTANNIYKVYINNEWKDWFGTTAAAAWYGDRGITAGGKFANTSTGKITRIDYKDITSSNNATTFGNLSDNRDGVGSVSDASRMVIAGGNNNSGDNTNTMEYITISTTGDVTDFGDLTGSSSGLRYYVGGFSDASRGVFASWDYGSDMEYINIQTTGNGTNFGELSNNVGYYGMSTGSDGTYGIMGGGFVSSSLNVIHRVTIQTAGDSADFGDLSQSRGYMSTAISNANRVCFAGGVNYGSTNSNVIDYVVASTAGNATDLGDLNVAMRNQTGTNNATLGIVCGGSNDNGSTIRNDIQKFTIDTAGNASDYGDLSLQRLRFTAASGNAS